MALALALSPAYVVRPHVGPLPTTVLELALLAAIAVGFYAFWPELPWRSPYTWPALVLLIGATAGTVFTASTTAKALGIWKAYFIEPAAAALVIAAIARRPWGARLLLAGLGSAGGFVAAANVAVDARALATHTYNFVTPPVAIFNTGNAVPLYLEPLAAIAVGLWLFGEQRSERWLAAAAYALYGLAIAFSFSRAGWLTLIVLTMVVAAFHRSRAWVLGGAAGAVLSTFAVSGQVRRRIEVELDPASPDNTVALRQDLWRSTLNMLAHRPLFGSGLDGFKPALRPYQTAGYHESLIYPHNVVLNFWSETGLIGLAGFLWLFAQLVRTVVRGVAGQGLARAVSIGMVGALVAFAVHGLVDAPYFKNDLALAFWALLGLQFGLVDRSERGHRT